MTRPLDPAGLVRALSRETSAGAPSMGAMPSGESDGHPGMLARVLGDEATGVLHVGTDRGALSFTRSDAARFHSVPFETSAQPGPVAVVTHDARRLTCLLDHLAEVGLGTSFAVAADTHDSSTLADWVSIAVRHPHTALLLLDVDTPEHPETLAEAIAPLSEQLPVLRCRGIPASPERALEGSWWASLGVLRPSSDSVAAASARLLVGPLPTVGDRWHHVTHSSVGEVDVPHTARTVCNGLDPLIDAVNDALSTTHVDAVVVSLPTLTAEETARIHEASRRWAELSDEVACILTSHAGALACHQLATRIPPALAVLDGRAAGAALRLAATWPSESGTARLRALPGPADPSRLRRVAADIRRLPHLTADPATQKEIAAGLGLPAAPHSVVRYLEDTLMASANLGFPIELSVWNPGGKAPDIRPEIAEDSTDARQAAEAMLGAARRASGMEASLVLRPLPRGAPKFRVEISCHARFGPVVRIEDQRGNVQTSVGLPGPSTYSLCLEPLQLPAAHHQAACSALRQATEVAYVGHRVLLQQSSGEELLPVLTLGPLALSTGGPLIIRAHLEWSRRPSPAPGPSAS